jgi:hypothetical protein
MAVRGGGKVMPIGMAHPHEARDFTLEATAPAWLAELPARS